MSIKESTSSHCVAIFDSLAICSVDRAASIGALSGRETIAELVTLTGEVNKVSWDKSYTLRPLQKGLSNQ